MKLGMKDWGTPLEVEQVVDDDVDDDDDYCCASSFEFQQQQTLLNQDTLLNYRHCHQSDLRHFRQYSKTRVEVMEV